MGRVVAMEQAAEKIGLLYEDVKVEGGRRDEETMTDSEVVVVTVV